MRRIQELISLQEMMSKQPRSIAGTLKIPSELLVFSLWWNPEEGGFNTTKRIGWINLLGRVRTSRQRAKASFSHDHLWGLQPEVWSRFRVSLSTSTSVKNVPHSHAQLGF